MLTVEAILWLSLGHKSLQHNNSESMVRLACTLLDGHAVGPFAGPCIYLPVWPRPSQHTHCLDTRPRLSHNLRELVAQAGTTKNPNLWQMLATNQLGMMMSGAFLYIYPQLTNWGHFEGRRVFGGGVDVIFSIGRCKYKRALVLERGPKEVRNNR